MSVPWDSAGRDEAVANPHMRDFIIVAGVVMAAALFGILTRPMGFLAAFWPANAILLGMMVRWPRLAAVPNWIAAFVAYIAADLLTGGEVFVTLWLTAANLIGAITGYLLFQLVSEEDRQLRRPLSVLCLLGIVVGAAGAAALTGGGAARLLFGRDFLSGLEFWFTTELVNALVILPVLLTFPHRNRAEDRRERATVSQNEIVRNVAPLATLVSCAAISFLVGGPGAIAFTVPALVWCALSYSIFTTAVVTALLCSGLLVSTATGLLALPMTGDFLNSTNSIRLGIALIAVGPLTVSAINRAREDLMAQLSHAARHDALTGALSRRAFMDDGYATVVRLSGNGASCALLMLDLDHFKRINDNWGHAAGDKVLTEFARLVSEQLRPRDIFGRLGGEEFGILLPEAGLDEAVSVAERIRAAVARSPAELDAGPSVPISVSIGVSVIDGVTGACLDALMARSDRALYGAKAEGRNAVRAAA